MPTEPTRAVDNAGQAPLPSTSVVICAYTEDRGAMLVDAITSTLTQTHLPTQVVVVIDHNRSLFDRCAAALPDWSPPDGPPLLLVENRFDGRLGSARNTGVAECTGEIVAFLDDDAAADPEWLAHLVAPYLDHDVVAVGGAPLPVYETARPDWFPAQMDWVFGCYYDGLPETLAPTRRLIGASMSARRAALEDIGGFQSDNHDDMDMCHRLAASFPSGRIMLEPKAIVRHNVVAERVTWTYFWRRCFFVNRGKARALHDMGAAGSTAADREFVLGAIRRSIGTAIAGARRGDVRGAIRLGALIIGVSLAAIGFSVGQLELRREAR